MRKHYCIPNEADQLLRERETDQSRKIGNIITFNGQGRSGKSTQAEELVKSKPEKYIYAYSHTLRDNFVNKFYGQLTRSEQQFQIEVLGIPWLAWLTADFHWRVKPLLLRGNFIVFDHYLGDYYADMLPNGTAENFQCYVRENLAIPHFKHGTHFYLDIDYDTYKARSNRPQDEWFTVNSVDFKARRARYQELCSLGYLICIDATKCPDIVFEEIRSHLDCKSKC